MTDTIPAVATDIATDAKKSHSLRDRLKGVKLATRKVPLFPDADLIEAFQIADRDVRLVESVANQRPDDASLQDELEQKQAARADAHTALLATALSVHLRAVPEVVLDAGRRETRKRFAVSGQIPADQENDAEEFSQGYILGRVIQKVAEADGTELDFDRDHVATWLREALPLPQWMRLVSAFQEVVYSDRIGEAATGDPGF